MIKLIFFVLVKLLGIVVVYHGIRAGSPEFQFPTLSLCVLHLKKLQISHVGLNLVRYNVRIMTK